MKKLAIIGGGVIGSTLAHYIDNSTYEVTLFDSPVGQATTASAGIISPWLSKRRNQKWYHLAKDGAAFFPRLLKDLALPTTVYQQTGTIILRKENELDALAALAVQRQQTAPEIGEIHLLTKEEVAKRLPILKPAPALFISGGGKFDGAAYLAHLQKTAPFKGIHLKQEFVSIEKSADSWLVQTNKQVDRFDALALCPGAGLPALLDPLGYRTDIRPQKGQLLVFETDYSNSNHWPVAMLDGESDLIPFQQGKIVVGATHENEAGFNLTPTLAAFDTLKQKTTPFLKDSHFFEDFPYAYRVGTRAYTSDFAPFFQSLDNEPTVVVASGLGSSGLTTGPYIGYLLARYFNTGQQDWMIYQKPLTTYLKPK